MSFILLTKDHFDKFTGYCDEYVAKLHLGDWSVFYSFEESDGVYATTNWEVADSSATITLAKKWDGMRPLNDITLKRLALHEVLHIACAPLIDAAEARFTTQIEINRAEHQLIHRIENLYDL